MQSKLRLLVAFVALTSTIGALTGCQSRMGNGGVDADLISENPSKKPEQPKGSGPLWPLTPGRSWKTLTMRPDAANENSEIRVIGALRLRDGRTGTLVRSYRNGKQFRSEVYQVDSSGGLKLMALGETEQRMLIFTPAIPFLAMPAKEGQELSWSGTAQIDNKTFSCTAFHRLSAVDSVKTPFDTIATFRLDGIISLSNGTSRVDYPAVMWFVPGKGVAQRRLADKKSLAVEVITRFPG